MMRWVTLGWIGIAIGGGACGGGGSEASAVPAPAPAAAPVVPATPTPAATPAPAQPAQPAQPAATPSAATQVDNACAAPQPQTLTLELGVTKSTPWQLDVAYAVDDDRKLGPGFLFFLHQGERRWETRRDAHNW